MELIEALYITTNVRDKLLKESDDQSRFGEIFTPPGPIKSEMG
jgi:hypothetical protein